MKDPIESDSRKWHTPPQPLTLDHNTVHIWRASLDQPSRILQTLSTYLSPDEQQRAARFHFDRDRTRYITDRGILRSILGKHLDIAPDRLLFSYGPRGKPELIQDDNIPVRFNVSHTQAQALFAVTRDRVLGIDIEYMRPLAEIEHLAEQCFSVVEQTVFRGLPEQERQVAFYRCWTRKEAYVKALGDGLAAPLDRFDVTLGPGEPARLIRVAADPDEAQRWSMHAFSPGADTMAAVIVNGHDWKLLFRQWSPDFIPDQQNA